LTKEGQQITRVWQNGGGSAKLNICTSINICVVLNICALNAPTSPSPKPLAEIVKQNRRQNEINNFYIDIYTSFNLWTV
jgi:hypothetical protein